MTAHLIHIGYPKAASVYLRNWFAQHPQLDYVEGGIAGFRGVGDIVRAAASPASHALYRVTSSEGLATPLPEFGNAVIDHMQGRAVSLGEAQKAACDLLADFFPNAKVLIVTRGFASSIPSMYSQNVRTGSPADFASFCADLEIAVREERDGWNFCYVIGHYRRRFGSENVIVLPYELLRDDAHAFTNTLASRLGIEPFAPSTERLNAGLMPAELLWYPRVSRALRRVGAQRLLRLFSRGVQGNRLRVPMSIVQRVSAPSVAMNIPASLLDAYRGRCECLRDEPLYAPYARDYLF